MDTILQDMRFAVRTWTKTPAFALIAIVTVALGIGANTLIFSIVDAVLLRPLPFRDPQRLVIVWENPLNRRTGSHGVGRNVVGPANFVRWREQNRVFEELAAGIAFPMNLTGGPQPERVSTGIVSPNLFQLLGVQPVLGRAFTADEEQPGKDNVVVLSRGYWQRRFGGDANVIGRTLQLNGQPVTVVGVMPDRMNFPGAVELWTPLTVRPTTRNARGRYLNVVARLKPGVSVAQAQSEMDVIASRTRAELPDFDAAWGVTVISLGEQFVGNVRQALYVLLGAVGFVLLIACANVANLLLARATAREREIAIRLALGAGRGRIARQLLTESCVLALAGGGAGLLLALLSIGPIVAMLPPEVPAFRPITINPQVMAFTLVVSALTGVLFGLAPALRVSSASPQGALKEGGRGATAGRERHGVRSTLVVVETATALVLLTAAGLLLHSFARLMSVDSGLDPKNVLTLEVSPTSPRYQQPAPLTNYFEEAVQRVRTVPGVVSAAAVSWIPLDGLGSATSFLVDDLPKPKPGDEPVADVRAVTEGYFSTMGIALQGGRDFNTGDAPGDEIKKVVVNRTLANQFWPGQNPIGKRITMDWGKLLHAEVIGVTADVKLLALDAAPKPALYWYLPQFPNGFMSFMVRTGGDPMQRLADIRGAITSVDPEQPIGKVRTMQSIVDASVHQPQFVMLLLGGFAGLALLLAAIGIYGVISYSVTQRTHEIGVRIALGARRSDIVRLVVVGSLRLLSIGLGIGLVAALAGTRLLRSLLFATRPEDPAAFAGVLVVMALVAALASYLPARRAASVQPVEALRYE